MNLKDHKSRSSQDHSSPSTDHTYLRTHSRCHDSPRQGANFAGGGIPPSPPQMVHQTPSWGHDRAQQRIATTHGLTSGQDAGSNFRRALQAQAHLDSERAAAHRNLPAHGTHFSSHVGQPQNACLSYNGAQSQISTAAPTNAGSEESRSSLHQAHYGTGADGYAASQ